VSSNDFNGPYRPAGGRGADDYSGGANGAGRHGGGAGGGGAHGEGRHSAGRGGDSGRGYTRGGGNGNGQDPNGANGANGRYPDPEGWGDDGFWRDSSMDSDYETGLNKAVRTNGNGPRGNGGYSYWADGKGWENSPGNGTAAGNGSGRRNGGGRPGAGAHTRLDSHATRMDGHATRADRGAAAGFGAGAGATAFYGGQPAPGGPAPGAPGTDTVGYRDGRRRPLTGPLRIGRGTRPGGPGGPGRVKVKGSWWRHWSWKKVLGLVGVFFGLFVLLLVGTYYYLYNSTQIPTHPVADISWQNSTVFYSDGTTPIGTFGDIHRQVLTYNQIPKVVDDAVMAAEDRNFMTEGGISPTGILRAAYEDIFGSGSLQGGSTITQQFVRNYYQEIGTAQTTSRKIKEIFVAMKISKEHSKQWILQQYLNMIYLGTGAYGVGAAAQTYFHEPVGKLTVAQAAVIAAIIQQPNNYPQPQYRPELISRWHYVLDGMVSMGDLTQQQADTMAFPTMYDSPEQSYGPDPWDPYVMNVVQNELEGIDHLTVQQLNTGGYKIVTTISRSMEASLYKAVNENVKLIRQEGYSLPSYAMIGAELQNPATGAIVAMYPGRGQNMSAKQCAIYDCDLNTAVYAREQVGSSFKPYVLATAVSEGMNVQTSVLNASPQLWVPPDTEPLVLSATSAAKAVPEAFAVHNDGYETIAGTKAGGATTVQNALAQSSNTAYTDLAHRAGTAAIVRMAAKMGVNIAPFPAGSNLSDLIGQVGMALGTASLTVNEQATMLSTIDNNGTYHSAHIVASYQASGGPVVPGMVTQYQAIPSGLDSQVQYAMEATTVYGTGTAAEMSDGRPIIGKTGTTTNAKSAFFIGAIPQYSLAVGIFTQSQNPNSPQSLTALGGGGFGGIWPAAIWRTFAEMEFAKLPIEYFQQPDFTGAKWVQVAPQPPKKKKPQVCTKFRFRCPPPGGGHGHNPFPTPSVTATPTRTPPFGGPTPTVTATGTGSPTATATPTGGRRGGGPTPTPGGVQAGLALGGILAVLPGSLLWTRVSRRRRRRRPGTAN
jgi:membrane peptidoglycan carboxypeptidase